MENLSVLVCGSDVPLISEPLVAYSGKKSSVLYCKQMLELGGVEDFETCPRSDAPFAILCAELVQV